MNNNELLTALNERQELVRLINEADARIEELTNMVKDFMGDTTSLLIGPYKVTWKEVTRNVADTDKMKADGIYAEYSKKQVTRPFKVN